MKNLMRRMDRVAGKLEAKLDSLSPVHDLTDDEEAAFLRWSADHSRTGNVRYDPRALSDRELWKIISPFIAEWRASQAHQQFNLTGARK
jgi:hypothetical protein